MWCGKGPNNNNNNNRIVCVGVWIFVAIVVNPCVCTVNKVAMPTAFVKPGKRDATKSVCKQQPFEECGYRLVMGVRVGKMSGRMGGGIFNMEHLNYRHVII